MSDAGPGGASPIAKHASTPQELKDRLAAERSGVPHLVYRDAGGRQVIRPLPAGDERIAIGRSVACEVSLAWDGEVSRVHAELEAVGSEWAFADNGLSRNGSFLNGERLPGRTLLRDGDAIVVGRTVIVYRRPGPIPDLTTRAGRLTPIGASVTDTDRRVLVALCRPLQDPDRALPASNQAIAEELHMSVPAVKKRLTALFIRFELDRLPQSEKRTRLALAALQHGLVR